MMTAMTASTFVAAVAAQNAERVAVIVTAVKNALMLERSCPCAGADYSGSCQMVYIGGFDLLDGDTEVCFHVFDTPSGQRLARVVMFQEGATVDAATMDAAQARQIWKSCRDVALDSGRNEM